MEPASSPGILKQSGKTRLFKMPVRCERLLNSMILHHDKADAICQRPILILPLVHELHSAVKKVRVELDDTHAGTRAKSGYKREKVGMVGRSCASIAQFQQNELSREDRTGRSRFGQRPGMKRIVRPKQREVERSVGEDDAHDFFGSPLT